MHRRESAPGKQRARWVIALQTTEHDSLLREAGAALDREHLRLRECGR